MAVEFQLSEYAKMPHLGTQDSVGYDLYSTSDVTIGPLQMEKIDTGLIIKSITKDIYIQIISRSGLALKKSLFSCGGLIDPDYKGAINVLLYNGSTEIRTINRGERIAQMLFLPISRPTSSTLNTKPIKTERGISGFGSTGI